MFTCVICGAEEYSEGKSGWSDYEEIKKSDENNEILPVCDFCLESAEGLSCHDCTLEDCRNYVGENTDSLYKNNFNDICMCSLQERYHMKSQYYGFIE